MSLCVYCGLGLSGNSDLCPHHTISDPQDWVAAGNRIMCDFFHRWIIPPRLDPDPPDVVDSAI